MGTEEETVMRGKAGTVTGFLLALSTVVLLLATMGWAADNDSDKDQSDVQKRIQNAATVLNEIMASKDNSIPSKIMSDAECVAVVPNMVKIAIGFGGSHGKGVATCKTANGWSAPAPFSITGGSWGLQIGGQAIDLVLLAMNNKGMDALLSSKFKIGADASAAAGPVGRAAEASTDWKMKSELLTYSRARGVFAGIDLSGAKVSQDKDETRILYGKMVPFATILSGKVPPPAGSEAFLTAVRKYSTESKEQGNIAPVTETTSAQK
jgi:lipid-binding SYLF domain-containing protein